MQKTIIHIQNLKPEIVETTLVVSRFRFLRVGSRISELRVIILPGLKRYDGGDTNKNYTKTTSMQRKVGKTKVVSTISALNPSCVGMTVLDICTRHKVLYEE